MRVAVLSERASGTGAAQAAVELFHALNGAGIETCFLSAECGEEYGLRTSVFGDWRRLYRMLERCNDPGAKASWRADQIAQYHAERRRVYQELQDQLRDLNPDVVHLHNVSTVLSYAAVVHLSQSWPIVWTLHDRYVFDLFHNAWTTERGTTRTWEKSIAELPSYFGRDYLSRCEDPISFITPSRWLAELFRESPLGGNHYCRVIPNIVSTQAQAGQWTGDAVHAALGVDKLLLAVIPKTEYPLKGFDILREAHMGARARVSWDEDTREVKLGLLVTTQKDLGLTSVGIFTLFDLAQRGFLESADYLSQGKMRDLYGVCDALVIASHAENLPNVALEAIRDGCPILATAVGGVPEIVDDSVGVLVPANDAGALADGIVRITCAAQRHQYREALARRWDDTYAAEVVLQQVKDEYLKVMEHKPEV